MTDGLLQGDDCCLRSGPDPQAHAHTRSSLVGTHSECYLHNDSCYGHEAPLQLGLNILQELHLYFATKEKVLYVSAADAPPLSPP